MLDLREVAKNYEQVVARLATRGGTFDIEKFRALFDQRRSLHIETEALQGRRNAASDEIKKNPKAISDERRAELRKLGDEIKERETKLKDVEAEVEKILLVTPNVPHESVPEGKSADDNKVARVWGEKPNLPFTPKQHFELGEKLGLLDFERAAKVSGSRDRKSTRLNSS